MKRVSFLCLLGLFLVGGSGCAFVEPYIYGETETEAPEVEEEPEERDEAEAEEPDGESVPEETDGSDETSSEDGSDTDGDTEAVSVADHPEPEEAEPEPPDSPSDSEDPPDPPDPEQEFRFGAYQETSGTLINVEQTELPYGTHALRQEQNGRDIVYALRSDRVDLTQYVGMLVWIRGRLIRGYPENGGPEYLQVESVTPLQIGVLPAMTGY